MAKDKISDYSSTANSNTDIAGINIDEGCAPSGINDAIRTLMAQLKTWQSGGQDVYIHPAGSASAPSITANGDTNTGIFFPAADTIAFAEGGTETMRLDSSGNMGLGVTPSAYRSSEKAFQIGSYSSLSDVGGYTLVGNNFYTNSSNQNIYRNTAAATAYGQTSGQHQWYTVGSGTAGTSFTFTQAMTLDASGNLGIGTTSPSERLSVVTTSGRASIFLAGGTANQGYISYFNSTQLLSLGCGEPTGTGTNKGQQVNIDSSGNLLVGTTTGNVRLVVNGSTGAASFTGDDLNHYMATFGGKSASASTHYQIGFFKSTGSVVGSITHNDTTTTYNTSSDYRLKEVSGALSGYKERLLSLQPKQGTWKENGAEFRGFLAHEFAESYPSSVTGEKDAVDSDGNPRYQGMQAGSSEVVADLVAYIKELETRLSALEQA